MKTTTCSMCHIASRRPGGKNCRLCHRIYMQAWRMKQGNGYRLRDAQRKRIQRAGAA